MKTRFETEKTKLQKISDNLQKKADKKLALYHKNNDYEAYDRWDRIKKAQHKIQDAIHELYLAERFDD